jgi:hypothetical protein
LRTGCASGGKGGAAFNVLSSSSSSTEEKYQSDVGSRHIGFPPIHQFFLDVKVTRLTATDPGGGTGLMGVKGMEELGAGPVGNVLDGGKGYDLLLNIIGWTHNTHPVAHM